MKGLINFIFLIVIEIAPAFGQTQQQVPQTIREFYKKLNFVNACSTPTERSLLRQCADISQVPYSNGSDRLRKIYQAMHFVDDRISQGQEMMPNKYMHSPTGNADGLCQVVKYEVLENSIKIWVKVYQIDQESRSHFIAQYDKTSTYRLLNGKKMADLSNVTSFNEQAHEWFLTQDGWKKGHVNMVLVH